MDVFLTFINIHVGLGSLEADGEPPTMGATAEESSADILKLSKNVADRNVRITEIIE